VGYIGGWHTLHARHKGLANLKSVKSKFICNIII
jgi:hypothetical protein